MNTEHQDILKENALKLAKDHKKHCDMTCNISLFLVGELIEMAGIELTEDEKRELM